MMDKGMGPFDKTEDQAALAAAAAEIDAALLEEFAPLLEEDPDST